MYSNREGLVWKQRRGEVEKCRAWLGVIPEILPLI